MNVDSNGTAQTNAGKVYKSNQKKSKEQSELFYVKKRGLFRKAEQVVRYCNSEVFIIVHNHDSDKIFSFTSDKNFDLEKISDLVLRDCQQGAYLNKNRKFDNTDFEKVKHNLNEIQKYTSQAHNNHIGSPMMSNHQLMDKESMFPEETNTEDMSVSHQQPMSSHNNEHSAPTNQNHLKSPRNNQLTFNSHSNNATYENGQFSPKNVSKPRSESNYPSHVVNFANHNQQPQQQQSQDQYQQNMMNGYHGQYGGHQGAGYSPHNMQMMGQGRPNQQQIQNIDHSDFNMNGSSSQAVSMMQPQQHMQQYQAVQQSHKSPIRQADQYNTQVQGSPPKMMGYPFNNAIGSQVDSNQSFDNVGQQVNDINHYRNQEYKQRFKKQQLDQAVNNDDIFFCHDFDYQRNQQQKSQINMAQSNIMQQNQSTLAAVVPGKSGVENRKNPFNQNLSTVTSNSQHTIKVGNTNQQMSHYRSDVSESRKYAVPGHQKMQSMASASDRPNRENNFGHQPGGRHPHAYQMQSPSSFIDYDVADQVLTSPRNAPQASQRFKAVRTYTGLGPDQRSGVISKAHISQISVDKPQGFQNPLGSQLSEDHLDDVQYTSQKAKITSGVLIATSQIQQQNYGLQGSGIGGGFQTHQGHDNQEPPQPQQRRYDNSAVRLQEKGQQHFMDNGQPGYMYNQSQQFHPQGSLY